MDPYVSIEYGNKKLKTTTKAQAGRFPIWNEPFEIDVTPESSEIKFICMDKDFFKFDDHVRKSANSLK
jgi:Ca2+-dependent lipid-binding protein